MMNKNTRRTPHEGSRPPYNPDKPPEGGPVFYDQANKMYVDLEGHKLFSKMEILANPRLLETIDHRIRTRGQLRNRVGRKEEE